MPPDAAPLLTRDLCLGHIAQAKALSPVDLADFAAAPALAGGVPAGADDQRGGRAQQPPASGPEFHGGARGSLAAGARLPRSRPARSAQCARRAEPRSQRATLVVQRRWQSRRRRQQKPAAAAARGARREARGPAAQSGRLERGGRTRSPGSAPPPPPARPHGGRGEGQGGAGSAGGKRGAPGRGGAGRGGARSGRTGRPFALRRERRECSLSPGDVLRCLGEMGGGGESRECKGRVRGPLRCPPQPSTQGGGTTCGGGGRAGGAAEAGLPSPDVTSCPPLANQELPRPQPNSASLCSFPSFTLPACSLSASTTQSWSSHFPTHLLPPTPQQQLLHPYALSSRP